MKIITQDFSPQVWECIQDKRIQFLICGKRMLHTPFTDSDNGGQTCERFTHPIAILISTRAIVIPAFMDDCHDWMVRTPQEIGITIPNAQRALTQAWRMVESISSPTWPTKTFNFHFRADVSLHIDPKAPAQEKTMLRNITICLRWDAWKKRGLTAKQKAHELSEAGMATTTGQLTKAAENLGIW